MPSGDSASAANRLPVLAGNRCVQQEQVVAGELSRTADHDSQTGTVECDRRTQDVRAIRITNELREVGVGKSTVINPTSGALECGNPRDAVGHKQGTPRYWSDIAIEPRSVIDGPERSSTRSDWTCGLRPMTSPTSRAPSRASASIDRTRSQGEAAHLFAAEQIVRENIRTDRRIDAPVEQFHVARRDGNREQQLRSSRIGNVDDVQLAAARGSHRGNSSAAVDRHPDGPRQVDLAQQHGLIKTGRIDNRQARDRGHIGQLLVSTGRELDVVGVARREREGGDDARDRGPVVERIEPLAQLGEVADAIAVAIDAIHRRADGELDVVRQAIAVGILIGAGSERADVEFRPLAGEVRAAIAMGNQAADRIERGDVEQRFRSQEELPVPSRIAASPQHRRVVEQPAEDRLHGHEVVAVVQIARHRARADDRLAEDRRLGIVGDDLEHARPQAGTAETKERIEREVFARLQHDRQTDNWIKYSSCPGPAAVRMSVIVSGWSPIFCTLGRKSMRRRKLMSLRERVSPRGPRRSCSCRN